MRLSIIVPVYNVEEYLKHCLESVVVQMCTDFELILVDDGSTDRSGDICDGFAYEHPEHNIVVIHQPNGGLSAARNKGIEVSCGEYITFVDSDDYIDSQTLTENMSFLLSHPEVDMLEYPIEVYAGSTKAHMLAFGGETLHEDLFVDWIRRKGYTHSYACNKIFRATLWRELRFPVGVCFEDGAIMPDVIRCCKSIHYSSRGCYRYIAHVGTITTSYKYVKIRQLLTNNYRLYFIVKDEPSLRAESMWLWTCCLNHLIDMGRCVDVDKVDYKKIVDEVDAVHPPYKHLISAMLKGPKNVKIIKILPLPLVGLATYLRWYVALTATLR